jgi:hypothetical protein
MGAVAGLAFLVVGAAVLAFGLGMWVADLRPGKGHFHEGLAEPEKRPKPVTVQEGAVEQLRTGMAGYRLRLPQDVHPISAGVKGGIYGGLVIPIPALLYGLVSGHGIWYPINLLAGMVLPGVGGMSDAELEKLSVSLLLTGGCIHVVMSLFLGLMYGVLLPTLPEIPKPLAWGGLLAPILWTAVSYVMMGVVNPVLKQGVSWPWFILSQFVYGLVMPFVVMQAKSRSPVQAGALGGIVGGLLMPVPAVLWSLANGLGLWYPVNLLAGMVVPGLDDLPAAELTQFHANWFAIALVMHLVLSIVFAVAFTLFLPKLRPIPGPMAWGALMMPLLWTGTSYGLMGVVNPLLQQRVDWPWFIVSQFVFGLVASVVVIRSEKVHIPPAGRGPEPMALYATGR